MCARATLKTPDRLTELRELGITFRLPPQPRYNIAPTQPIPAVMHDFDYNRRFGELRWGLIPNWSKGPNEFKKLLINARGETVAHLPSSEHAFRAQRCLVLVDGFYEWKREGKANQPWYIHKSGGGPLAFAGLWDRWIGEEAWPSTRARSSPPRRTAS
jgi:putative SOS response-associated peptidase YedK